MAEQAIINRYRAVSLLEERQRQLRKERGRGKMREDQRTQRAQIVAEREDEEQILVEVAKARVKALAESLRAGAEEAKEDVDVAIPKDSQLPAERDVQEGEPETERSDVQPGNVPTANKTE
jgi:hypothetical protein